MKTGKRTGGILLCGLAVLLLVFAAPRAFAANNPGNGDRVPTQQVDFGCPGRGASNPGCVDNEETVKPKTPSINRPPAGGCGTQPTKTAFDYPDHFKRTIDLLRENWVAALQRMTEQFTVNMMHQMMMVGALIDAKEQVRVQMKFRDLQTQTHKTYQSSLQVCRFGTNVKSLAASDIQSKVNAEILGKVLMDRQMLAVNSTAGAGPSGDYTARTEKFGEIYCNVFENDGEVVPMCGNRTDHAAQAKRVSSDIDYTRMIDQKYTIDFDMTDTVNPTQEEQQTEEDILALGKNLFGNKLFSASAKSLIDKPQGMYAFLATRSVDAIRSVALHSFSSIVGLKAKGHQEVAPYLKRIVAESGMPETEIDAFIGQNPSYFAQMEVLSSRMYQNPNFYTNLYDKPENVKRTAVAMEAIKLMQDRDRFESALRREMMVSLILEVKLREHQKKINDGRIFAVVPLIYDRPPEDRY